MAVVWLRVALAVAVVVAVAVAVTSSDAAEEPCRFPAAWVGQWYWKETVFNITDGVLGSQGRCLERQETKYLIQREQAGPSCYVCVVMFERHRNIIEFKESQFCNSERLTLRQLCLDIGGDAPLHTMIRVDTQPVACPFKGAFTFDYKRSDRVCDAPISRVSACTVPWQLVLQHQACPDVAGAERLSEKLTCLATWRSYDEHFMFGRLDSVKTKTDADRYRCFIYERFDLGGGRAGFHVVQSGDSTCQGLQDVHEGHKVMNLYHEKHRLQKCQLPGWLTAHHEWHSMDSRQRYHIFHKNHSIRVSHQSRSGEPSADDQPTRLVCTRLTRVTANSVRVVFHHSRQCTTGYQCAMLYRRDKHVVELKFGGLESSPDAACRYFDESRHNFTTLVSAVSSHAGHPCPFLGRHAVIGVQREGRTVRDVCAGSFTTLVMGCSSSDTLELRSECPQRTQPAEYRCHGSWQEKDTHYLVASPLTRSSTSTSTRRVCFISQATADSLRFSSLHEACYRSVRPGREGALAFNVTVSGNCRAEASTSGSSRYQLATALVSWLLVSLLLVFAAR